MEHFLGDRLPVTIPSYLTTVDESYSRRQRIEDKCLNDCLWLFAVCQKLIIEHEHPAF